MPIEMKRAFKILGMVPLLLLPTAPGMLWAAQHRDFGALGVISGCVLLQAWLLVKWWVFEGKD